MIVVDSSALIAILFDEPERPAFENIVAGDCQWRRQIVQNGGERVYQSG
jgi:uncharacterized protein with PIN domain